MDYEHFEVKLEFSSLTFNKHNPEQMKNKNIYHISPQTIRGVYEELIQVGHQSVNGK